MMKRRSRSEHPDKRAVPHASGLTVAARPGSPSLDELEKAQGVGPIKDPRILLGGWPGEVDDGFEEAIRRHRQSSLVR